MPRKRMIDPDIWRNEQFAGVSLLARLLYIGLISNADDEGRFKASPQYIKLAVFPSDVLTPDQVLAARKELEQTGLIKIYTNASREYGYHPNWRKYQWPSHPSPSKLPTPPEVKNSGVLPEDSRNSLGVFTISLDQFSLVHPSTKNLIILFYKLLREATEIESPVFPTEQAVRFFEDRTPLDSSKKVETAIKYFFFYPTKFTKKTKYGFGAFCNQYNEILVSMNECGEGLKALIERGEKEWAGTKSKSS